MRHPTALVQNGAPSTMGIKRGDDIGVTIVRADGILHFSYFQNYFDNHKPEAS